MQSKTILLIEDDPGDIELTRRALGKNYPDIELVVLRDGVEAIEYFFGEDYKNRKLPHLILLDLKLTKVSGLELLEKLRSEPRTKLLPIVILSSSDEESDIEASYNLGANSYVCKPVNFVQLSEIVLQLGIFWLALNVSPPPVRGL
jgi:two-component system response regulator